jgi:hypothetical protein
VIFFTSGINRNDVVLFYWVDYTAFGIVIFLWSFCILLLPRKMQISGATDLASKGQAVSDSSNVKVKAEVEESFQIQSATKIRCLCGSTLETEDLIKVKHSNMFLRSLWSINSMQLYMHIFLY